MVRIKICGITNREDAACAVRYGADALGFIFYSKSPRYVSSEQVREIVETLPPFVTPVGVFVNDSREEIASTVRQARLQAIQLHGDESPEDCQGHDVPVIRAVRVGPAFDLETLTAYPVDTFLLDTAKTGFYGGTGETFDWSFAKKAKAYGRIVLSGGIGPDNVAEAVREVKPYAVDCGSGVEAEPGKKDHEKVARFLDTVRSMDR
ncbi:MAG: phosphoribosylanthranilate isomerase [bacterium]|nr:phosphoribosylanthranilate isomerase [bacterium]